MGRSVSYPSSAVQVCYAHLESPEDEADFGNALFRDCQEQLVRVLRAKYPSLYSCDKWLGREDHAILSNSFAFVGVSEYCGLVAVWLVERDDNDGNPSNLAKAWCAKVDLSEAAKSFGIRLQSIGTASNGEHFFSAIE